MDKLVTLLTARKLSPRFNVVPFLSVHDPEADVKNKVSKPLRHFNWTGSSNNIGRRRHMLFTPCVVCPEVSVQGGML